MASLAYASQNGIPENRIVRYTGCVASEGFLLARSGPIAEAQWWALYPDGTAEEINPVSGKPRPSPDPAVRTRHVSVPNSLRGLSVPAYASQFTGMMRQVVQCEFSRGIDTRFSYTFAKTHGMLAFPFEHASGSDKASEIAARKRRKHFVVEISDEGVYAAPVEYGIDCCSAARVDRYMASREDVENGAPPEARAQLNLAWYHGAKQGGRNAPVQRVITAEAYQAMRQQCGGPWYPGLGWAFSYSGAKASNVLNRVTYENGYAYRTSLVHIAFSVALAGQVSASIYRSGDVAVVSAAGHDLIEGGIVGVQGAEQPEYNGAHVAFDVSAEGFKFRVTGNPASPATGAIKLASLTSGATVSAGITVAEKGSVVFKLGNGGTLWAPESPGRWRGVYPSPDTRSGMDGPVHVFYDGEREIVTRWRFESSTVPEVHIYPPKGSYNWTGNASGTHAYGDAESPQKLFVCQLPWCEYGYSTPHHDGSGEYISEHRVETHGFYGTDFDCTVIAVSNRFHGTANTTTAAIREQPPSVYWNMYELCPDCQYTEPDTGRLVTWGSATIESIEWLRDYENLITESRESQGGGSYAMMLFEEREAIVAFQTFGQYASVEQKILRATAITREKQTRLEGDSPFTDIDVETQRAGWFMGQEALPGYETRAFSGVAEIRAAGGFAQARTLEFDAEGNLQSHVYTPFMRFVRGDEYAESSLFMMRGAQYYPDPTLTPADQSGNRWYYLDDKEGGVLEGGFVNPGNYSLVGFVGKV